MILVEREIRTAPAEVWAVMSELDRWAELLPTVSSVERLSDPGPIAVGARFRVAQPGLATAVYEVTAWRPGAGFTWVASSGGVRTEAVHEARADGEGRTRLALGITWSGSGAWVARVLFSGKARRYMTREAEAFAALAEGR